MKEDYSIKNCDHLRIVSVICDEIGSPGKIDSLISPDPQMETTLGECMKLRIINGRGLTSRPLYLEAQLFESRFLGRDCAAEINEDRLGRALDQYDELGCNQLFATLASPAAIRYGVSKKLRHRDSTRLSVAGKYESEDSSSLITFSDSKDHRPDLSS